MEQPQRDIWDRFRKVWQYFSQARIPVYASYASYFIILSLFPSLLLLLGLLRYTGLAVDTLTQALTGLIPGALLPAAKRLIVNAYRNTTASTLSVSAVVALWSASRGVYGLLTGLNAVYCVEEDRGYLRTRAVSVGYTFLFLLVLLVTLILQVFGTQLLRSIPALVLPGPLSRILDFRFVVLVVLQTGIFAGMFTVLPNRRRPFRESLPGAALGSLGWLVFSGLFSVYVEHFSGYASIYGSVYAVALSMLWLYCCVSILFYGGALNRYLSRQSE